MQEDREFWVNACCMLGRGRGGSGNTNAVQAFFLTGCGSWQHVASSYFRYFFHMEEYA